MGMQLRVRHSLGARLIEIDQRPAEAPLRIGRDPECEVRIPSSAVAPVHCYLFVQDGRWVVQDAGDASGVFINGQPVAPAAYVSPGDVITLGTGAVAIELDPLGVARRTAAAASASSRPPTPAAPSAAESSFAPAAQRPADTPPTPESAGTYELAADEEHAGQWESPQDYSDDDASVHLGRPAPRDYYHAPARRPVVSSRHNATAAALLVGLLAMLGVAVAVFLANRKRPEPQPTGGRIVLPEETGLYNPKTYKRNIFDDMNRPQPPSPRGKPQTPVPRTEVPGTPTPPRVDMPDAPENRQVAIDPRKLTDDWKRVEESRIGRDYGKTIWNIEDYRKLHPGQFEDELKQWAEEALDLLWWARIKELCERRDRAMLEIQDLNRRIAEETDQEFKQGLIKERKRKEDERAAVMETLTVDMGYTANEIPNDQDDAQLASLRRQREAAKYQKWCERVVKYARDRNGELPWQRTR